MSESKYNFSNRDLAIFFMVTFGFTIVMGIAMAFAYTKYNYPVDDFALVQMYYPTIGVMTALLLNKERHKNLPMKFYKTYLSFTIVSVILVLVEIFIFHQAPSAADAPPAAAIAPETALIIEDNVPIIVITFPTIKITGPIAATINPIFTILSCCSFDNP